ncbi:hypothetical protein NW762_009195 [Fusarium torreyae]|uniref:Ubiquitin-like protease family profile domain-containing protein n=1 Tax=Fusarium torreyae TaxID=1237075 RepID=A0A9W8RVP3_9HYPO|nr:hypothetical protein NW762_009195 [Fusarium torreyae]
MPRPSTTFTPIVANNLDPGQKSSARSNLNQPNARTPRSCSSTNVPGSPDRSVNTENSNSSSMASRSMEGPAADKVNRQMDWLNQEWGGRNWLPEDVRRAQRNRDVDNPSAVVVDYLVKITKLAQQKNVPLADLWSDTSPHNDLRRGVMGGLNRPRLTGELAGLLYSGMKDKLGSDMDDTGDTDDDTGDMDDTGDIDNTGNIDASEACESSSDDEDIEAETPQASNAFKFASDRAIKDSINVNEEPQTPPKTTVKSDARNSTASSTPGLHAHALRDAFAPRTHSAPPQPSVAGHSYSDQCHATQNLKRKWEGDDSATEGPPATKHGRSAFIDAQKVHKQLTTNEKLSDDVLRFLTNFAVACHISGMDQSKVRVVDPLWFKIHGENGLPGAIQKLDRFNLCCFPIYHPIPKHWSLGVIHITPGRMTFNYHDSMPDLGRTRAVKSRFEKWARGCGFQHDLAFKHMACPRQRDLINCGVHVLACLRHELENEPCPPTLDPTEEKQSIIRLLKTVDEKIHSGHDLDVLREVKRLFVEKAQEKFFNELRNTTSASLDENCKAAEMRRDGILNELKSAEKDLNTLLVKDSTLIEARDRIIQSLDMGDIDPAANNFQLDHPKKLIGMSQKEDLDSTISDVGVLIRRSRWNVANTAKQALEQHRQDVMEQIKEAREEIKRKENELEQVQALVGRLAFTRQMKQDIEGFSLMGPEIFNSN